MMPVHLFDVDLWTGKKSEQNSSDTQNPARQREAEAFIGYRSVPQAPQTEETETRCPLSVLPHPPALPPPPKRAGCSRLRRWQAARCRKRGEAVSSLGGSQASQSMMGHRLMPAESLKLDRGPIIIISVSVKVVNQAKWEYVVRRH